MPGREQRRCDETENGYKIEPVGGGGSRELRPDWRDRWLATQMQEWPVRMRSKESPMNLVFNFN